jgi:hypothetical protein
MSVASWDSQLGQSMHAILLEGQPTSEREQDLLSKLIERKHEPRLEPEASEEVTNSTWGIIWSWLALTSSQRNTPWCMTYSHISGLPRGYNALTLSLLLKLSNFFNFVNLWVFFFSILFDREKR